MTPCPACMGSRHQGSQACILSGASRITVAGGRAQAARGALLQARALMATLEQELPETAAALRLSGLELSDCFEEVSLLRRARSAGAGRPVAGARALLRSPGLCSPGLLYNGLMLCASPLTPTPRAQQRPDRGRARVRTAAGGHAHGRQGRRGAGGRDRRAHAAAGRAQPRARRAGCAALAGRGCLLGAHALLLPAGGPLCLPDCGRAWTGGHTCMCMYVCVAVGMRGRAMQASI